MGVFFCLFGCFFFNWYNRLLHFLSTICFFKLNYIPFAFIILSAFARLCIALIQYCCMCAIFFMLYFRKHIFIILLFISVC